MEEKLEYQIKISGGFYIDQPIEAKRSVMIGVELDVYSAEKRDLQEDNRFLIVYRGKPVGMPIVSQGEKKFRTLIKSGKSKILRWKIQEWGENYDEVMDWMINNFEDVIEFVRTKRNLH